MSSKEPEKKPWPAPIFRVDKKGAAQRQLESAIMLWFQTAESVSIHTLAVAANDCYRAMGKHAGIGSSMVQDWLNAQSGQVREAVLYAQNFFKHGFKGLSGLAPFTPLYAEMLILESASFHERLYEQMSPLMLAFALRFVGENPHIVQGPQQATVREIINARSLEGIKIDDLFKLERRQFLETLAPSLGQMPLSGSDHVRSP
jgi:hypothetical protein